MNNKKHLIWIVFDGVAHSVFAGQVLEPATQLCKNNSEQSVTIITFEKSSPSDDLLVQYNNKHSNLSVVAMRKLPFLGRVSLWFALLQLKNYLKQFDSYELKARGPLAGWLAYKSLNDQCEKFTVQARGLLAQEYLYRHGGAKNMLKKLFHLWRYKELEWIEQAVYGKYISTIEAVSQAMKKYLIRTFNADPDVIYIAQDDIPKKISVAQRIEWRDWIRSELSIGDNVKVYCYSGSVKAWQKPDELITYFKLQYLEDQKSFLLILTADVALFESKLREYSISEQAYKVITVSYDKMYHYLSAADVGLIFRDKNIVSWVARPVKAMEYQSVGLEVVHNDTVDWLMQKNS